MPASVVAMALFSTAIAATNPQPKKSAPSARSQSRPNVILITIDTLRADHVGCYGAQNVKTPTLDGLAHDGVLFERAISQVPLTWPSHAVILTGTYPFQNGVQDFTGQPLAPQFRSIAQAFKQAGYATGAVVSAFVLDRSWGLGRGFDFYDDAFSAETFQKREIGLVDRRAQESVAHAIAWLKKTPRRPFFFWLHLYDPHNPYDPPEPYRTDYKGHLYDGEISYADHQLGNLIFWLKQNKLYDSSLIVATSDHGESLGEHGEDEHGFFIYNATVHIPLIVKPAAGSGISRQRRRDPVETTSVAASLLQLAGVKDVIEKQFQAKGLFDGAPGSQDHAYSETFYPFSSFGWSPLHAVQSERFHYIDAPQPELYDLQSDPEEAHNIAAEQPATVVVLKEKLQQRLARNPFTRQDAGAGNLSPDAQEKLRALGYFGFRAAVPIDHLKDGLPDPKDKLWEFNSILHATDAFHRGNYTEGEELLNAVRDKDSNIYIVPFLLGEDALRRQQWDEAASELKKCLALNPGFDQAMMALGRALIFQGKKEEAEEWAQKAVTFNPQNYRAWYQLGFIKSMFDKQAAIQDYERAVSIQGNFPPLRRDLAMLYFEKKDYKNAIKHFAKAIEFGVAEAPVYNYLGISYSRTNQLAKAVQSYQRALAIDPRLADVHLNLAFAYQRMDRANAARDEYNTACHIEERFCRFVPALSGQGR